MDCSPLCPKIPAVWCSGARSERYIGIEYLMVCYERIGDLPYPSDPQHRRFELIIAFFRQPIRQQLLCAPWISI